MAARKKIDLLDITQQIVSLNPKMRFAAIIDSKGNIREGIMKKGQTSLNSQKEEEHFCKQVAQRRAMRKEFDRSLGKVNYIHVERENVSQLVIYTKRNIVFFTVEPETPITTKIKLVDKIKAITVDL
ncbi:MAG: hypothetical protein HN384_05775 [Nitrosopumilus sp.]|jgi:hypothetical protein|nr:hypothetical protein [Nitrosopumilus sp.]MBT6397127.1 hypothetical protein [Nitrosopumilus sp.]MBT6806960.1 hypothetical protein [Nitrosopumilus sp.]